MSEQAGKHSLRRLGVRKGKLGMIAERWSEGNFFISVFIFRGLLPKGVQVYFSHSEANVEWDWRLWQLILRVWTQRDSCCHIYTDESGSTLAFIMASEL